jgi:hypothetical protein
MGESLIDIAWSRDITRIPKKLRMEMDNLKIRLGAEELIGTKLKDAPDSTLTFFINECKHCSDKEKSIAILLYREREYETFATFKEEVHE